MSKKIDQRLPREIGEGVFPNHSAIKSPWEKLVSYYDAAYYAERYHSVVAAAIMQAYRILVPDYVERSKALCKNAYGRMWQVFSSPYGAMAMDQQGTHPFCRGNFCGGLTGDAGDDKGLMYGRVNDFGTYRVEKELDNCAWDIIGTELCRSTTQSLEACGDGIAKTLLQPGPQLEYHMVEARGAGDLHCRIVAESRDKYPMPDHEAWECFGPIATADQIKFTPEEEMLSDPMVFREECGFEFISGTCWQLDSTSLFPQCATANGAMYLLPAIDDLIKDGTLEETFVEHVLKCVLEAAGKAAFGEFYAKEGLRNWLGVPSDIDDGRVMGAHIEMFLQISQIPYEIEAFNKEEVVYVIDRTKLSNRCPKLPSAYVSYWYGMTKTLVSAQWSLWEEAEDAPEDKVRIKIAKKIDKFC